MLGRRRTVQGAFAAVVLAAVVACSPGEATEPGGSPAPTVSAGVPADQGGTEPTTDGSQDGGAQDGGAQDGGAQDDGGLDDGGRDDDVVVDGDPVDSGPADDDLLFLDGDRPDATGAGVALVVVDSGVDWRHPDLRAGDGSTRIAAIVDLSGQTAGCAADRPEPVVIGRDAIDRALAEGADLDHIDAVGRGTALVGLAAGNGAAAGGRTAGVATDATVIVVKQTSEGVPPSSVGPGGRPVSGCLDDALDEVDRLLDELGLPAVLLASTGSQWGPLDGTSATSRRLAASFGGDTPGRILVTGAGDEGGGRNHARVQVTPTDPVAIVPFERRRAERSNPTLWYRGDASLLVSIRFDDGTVVGPVGPGESVSRDGVEIIHYEPGTEFHPWTSTSGDRAVWMVIERPGGGGEIILELPEATSDAATDPTADVSVVADVFGDLLGTQPATTSIEFIDHLAEARVTDLASTPGAVVVTAHVARDSWRDRRGRFVEPSPPLAVGVPWPGASSGPTRDGRSVVAISAPGHHAIAPLAAQSLLVERDELQPFGVGNGAATDAPDARADPTTELPDGGYVIVTGTGAAAAIVAGVAAAMLEVAPQLTGAEVAELLATTANEGRLGASAAVRAAGTTAS